MSAGGDANGSDVTAKPEQKMIVFGIPYQTTSEGFRDYFAQYGELLECELMFSREGRSRGFGFVLFKDEEVNNRVKDMQHSIDGRSLDLKLRDMGDKFKYEEGRPALSKTKIFIGRLGDAVEPEDLRQYFEQFGAITDVFMPVHHATGKRKNCGFVEFQDPSSASQALEQSKHVIKGVECTAQAAAPKVDKHDRRGFDGYGMDRFGVDRGFGRGFRNDYGGWSRDGRDSWSMRDRSPRRFDDPRMMGDMMGRPGWDGMGGMGAGMEDMWSMMFERMREMYDRGDPYGMGASAGYMGGAGYMPGREVPAWGAAPVAPAARYAAAGEMRRLLIENIPRTIAWQTLKDLFKRFGNVVRADVYPDGQGTVVFDNPNDARNALTAMNGHLLEGNQIRIRLE